MVKILLENADTDVNAMDSDELTVLIPAVAFKDLGTVKLLLAHPRIEINKLGLFDLVTALDQAKGSKMKKVLRAAGAMKSSEPQ